MVLVSNLSAEVKQANLDNFLQGFYWPDIVPTCPRRVTGDETAEHLLLPCPRPVGRPFTSWMATLKSDLSLHNLTFEDASELALDKSLWRLLVASGATHWYGACRIMMMMMPKMGSRTSVPFWWIYECFYVFKDYLSLLISHVFRGSASPYRHCLMSWSQQQQQDNNNKLSDQELHDVNFCASCIKDFLQWSTKLIRQSF